MTIARAVAEYSKALLSKASMIDKDSINTFLGNRVVNKKTLEPGRCKRFKLTNYKPKL